MSIEKVNKICKQLQSNFNAYHIDKKSDEGKLFIEVAKENKDSEKTLVNLVNNLEKKIKTPSFLSGPGYIQKFVCKKYDKTIYLFGENDHSNLTACDYSRPNTLQVYSYLMDILKNSPVFIDFYVELALMLEYKEQGMSKQQTLYDIFETMEECFGPQIYNCKYNARLHSVDARLVLKRGQINYDTLQTLTTDLMMLNVTLTRNRARPWIHFNQFRVKHRSMIDRLSTITSIQDLVSLVIDSLL